MKILIFLILVFTVIFSMVKVTKSVATGQASFSYPVPLYGFLRTPDNLPFNGGGRFGGDYACLYFNAKNYRAHQIMYDINSDPFGRPAVTFPPQLIFLIAETLANVDFPLSVLLSNYLQIFLFLFISIYFLKGQKLSRQEVAWGVLFTAILLFWSPVGVTWFERGQTDLFGASAYLLLMKAMRDDTKIDFIMAGIVGSLKWSCLPFFALSGLTYILISKDKKIHRTIWIGITLLIPFLLLIPFGKNSYEYFTLVKNWESQMTPGGLSLAVLFPRFISKIIPFSLPLIATWIIRNWRRQNSILKSATETLIWGGFGMVGAAFGTVSAEYKLVCMLFLIPFILDRRLIFFNETIPKINRLTLIFGASILAYALRFTLNLHFIDKIIGDRREIVPLVISVAGLITLLSIAGTNLEEA